MKKGAYLGGICSVQTLMERCVVDDLCGCWIYRGYQQDGMPKIHFRLPGGQQKTARGRRAAWCVNRGRNVPPGLVVFAAPHCEHVDCVNPAHCRVGTPAERGAARRGEASIKMIQANTANGMKRAKLDWDKVRAIRASDERLAVEAEKYGVVTSCISAIRRGEAWQEQMLGASVFRWRP